MNRIIRIGVLGCASIAQRYIIPALLELPGLFSLEGVASRTPEKAALAAERFGTRTFRDYDELLNRQGLEAVYIPLPNALHAEWIEKCLEIGLHVLVEKTLACNLLDVERLNNLASDKKIILLENFQFRFHCQLKRISEIIESGGCGDIRCIRSSFGFPPFPDHDNIRYQRELGGGALLDAGAYPIKISQVIMGDDIRVKAASLSYDPIKGVDIWGGGFLSQAHGDLFSEVAFGFDHLYQCSLEVWGSKGRLTANRIFTAPPGYEAEIIVEGPKGLRKEKMPPDNHFINMLCYFHELATGKKDASIEYRANKNQARLIHDFMRISNE